MVEDAECLKEIDPPDDCRHRFAAVQFRGTRWDLGHLDSFAFRSHIGFEVTVVVIFSCHCFTRGLPGAAAEACHFPSEDVFRDAREQRLLDPSRYALSRLWLRGLVLSMPEQHIIIAQARRRNFMTWRALPDGHANAIYAMFFTVERDTRRKGRMILRVQSAYLLDSGLTRAQKEGRKVRLRTLLKAAYEGRSIRP